MSLRPNLSETIYNSLMIDESIRQYGYLSKMIYAENISVPDTGFQQDVGYDDSKYLEVYILPVNTFNPRLLKKLGWNIENDPNTKPFIIQLSRFTKIDGKTVELKPTIYTKFIIEYDFNLPDKEFITSNVSSNAFNPMYYLLSLVPYRINELKNHYPLSNSNVINLDVTKKDERFSFISINKERGH